MKTHRRLALCLLVLTSMTSLAACADDDGGDDAPTDDASDLPDLGGTRLVVSDMAAKKLYVYEGETKLAELSGIAQNDHAGFLALPDGRVLLVDEENQELLAVQTRGTPSIVARAPVTTPVAHLAVDPALTYAVVSSSQDETSGALSIVDLASFEAVTVALTMGEPGLLIGGDPAVVFVRDGKEVGEIRAHLLSDLRAGNTTPVASVTLGHWPHGDVIAHQEGKILVATDEGLDVVPFDGTSFGERTTLAWEASGRTGGRAYFARLSSDGKALYSYIRNDFYPEEVPWAEWENDIFVLDLTSMEASRLPCGGGLIYRGSQAGPVALYSRISPGGDEAILLDSSPTSASYKQIAARLPLPGMSMAAGAEDSPWETPAFRATAISPDGRWGFVSAGGDGKVHVIDTQARELVGDIVVPSSLDGGGYLIAVSPSQPAPADTIGR